MTLYSKRMKTCKYGVSRTARTPVTGKRACMRTTYKCKNGRSTRRVNTKGTRFRCSKRGSSNSSKKAGPKSSGGNDCEKLMCSKGIKDKKGFLKWAAHGGHPDKGGSEEVFKKVHPCYEKRQFCK